MDTIVYTVTDIDIPHNDPLGVSEAVVKNVVDRYLGKGHTVYR